MLGHFEGDPQLYRTEAEHTLLKERDGIVRFERLLGEQGVMTADEIEAARQAARDEVAEAIEFARSSAYPAPESALEHVFAELGR